mgnify:CR=1 FL=1
MNSISKTIGSIVLLSLIFAHQFFISTTDVQFKSNEKRAEITIQVFTHDVNLLLENSNYNTVYLGTEKENDEIDIFLVNYLSDNFIIQDYRWKYVGKDIGLDYTLFFLEIENFSLPPKVAILNSIFMDLSSKQVNIVNFYNDNDVQSASMTSGEPVFSFSFE